MQTTTTIGETFVRDLFDQVFNQRALPALDALVAADYVEHALAPFETDEPGAVHGPSHMRGVVEWLVEQYPDLRMEVVAAVSQEDLVAVRVMSRGTNTGPLNGVVPATGRRFEAGQAHWYRVHDNKLSEHWAIRDDLRTMLQLGLISGPGPARPSGAMPPDDQ
jgi:predicted ester cyclase